VLEAGVIFGTYNFGHVGSKLAGIYSVSVRYFRCADEVTCHSRAACSSRRRWLALDLFVEEIVLSRREENICWERRNDRVLHKSSVLNHIRVVPIFQINE
jgi:hypothetical protein